MEYIKEYETCLFLSQSDTLFSYLSDKEEVHLDKTMIWRRKKKSFPSLMICTVFQNSKKINECGKSVVKGYEHDPLYKDELFNSLKDIERRIKDVDNLCYITTINGDTIVGHMKPQGQISFLYKGHSGIIQAPLTAYQREQLVLTIKPANISTSIFSFLAYK